MNQEKPRKRSKLIMEEKNNFSVKDTYGMNTLAFVINKTIEEGELVCSIEKLKCLMEQTDTGYLKTFYLPPMKEKERKELVFLTLKPGEAVLNAGEFFDGKLNLGRKPEMIAYSSFRTQADTTASQEFEYAPNFKRPMVIIDPELGDELKPILYFDMNANDVRAKITLLPNKSYIALEVREDETKG